MRKESAQSSLLDVNERKGARGCTFDSPAAKRAARVGVGVGGSQCRDSQATPLRLMPSWSKASGAIWKVFCD